MLHVPRITRLRFTKLLIGETFVARAGFKERERALRVALRGRIIGLEERVRFLRRNPPSWTCLSLSPMKHLSTKAEVSCK